jgi:hypothetical protein
VRSAGSPGRSSEKVKVGAGKWSHNCYWTCFSATRRVGFVTLAVRLTRYAISSGRVVGIYALLSPIRHMQDCI